jgi:DNA-binding IclR family transcriptional regulator
MPDFAAKPDRLFYYVKYVLLYRTAEITVNPNANAMNISPRIDGGTRYRNQAAQRVLTVLAAFVGRNAPCGVSELGRGLGMNKNMVHRALTMLTEQGYLARDVSGQRYQLGHRVLELAGDDIDEFDIRTLCRPVMEELHRVSGESVFLSIIVGRSRVNVDWIEGRGRRVSHSLRGRSVPLHCTKMSRVLLAHLSEREIADYLRGAVPLDRYAATYPDTADITEPALRAELRELRGASHVVWRNPRQFGAAYITVPLLDNADRPHAIVTVGGPLERLGVERIATLMPAIGALLAPLRQQCRLYAAAPVYLLGGEL